MSINNQVQSRNTTQVSTVRSSVPLQRPSQQACGSPVKPTATSDNPVSRCIASSAREIKPANIHSGAQTVSRSNAVPNAVILARELKPAIIHSGAQTVSRSNAVPNVSPQFKVSQTKNVAHLVPAGSSMAKTSISAGLHSNQKVHSNVTSVKEQEKRVSDSGSTPKEKVTEKNVVHAVPAGSSLTKTSISAGLPSDQKVHSIVSYLFFVSCNSYINKICFPKNGVLCLIVKYMLSQQDKHVTSMKDQEKIVSDPGSTPKEKVKEAGASALITQSQIDNKQNKVGLDLDKAKSTPSMKDLEHKAVPQNPGRCEEQGSVKNSIFIPKPTGNGNSNLNEESQVQNQDKKASSVNGSSNQPSKQE